MIGKTVSHYRITRELGAGGMGVVYEAVDTKLDRTVALKFLPPESTRDPEAKARFVHEAKAASAIDHPNVCNIYEIDETDDGQLFLAMACYVGETLKEKIARGPLPLDDALDFTRQVAEGLTEAHVRDIVHRDIKPANIFITDGGLAKILDFGLAKLAGLTKLTQEGTTLGTAHYMSPEQASGQEVDHRSDLWCLGVVLYEMVTGRVPFQSDHPQAVTYAILNSDPAPVTGLRTGVPLELERIIGKCLAKDPQERYQHADDLLADLTYLSRQSSSGATETLGTGQGRNKPSRRWPWIAAVGILSAIIGFAAWDFLQSGDGNPSTGEMTLAILDFQDIVSPDDSIRSFTYTTLLNVALIESSPVRVVSTSFLQKLRQKRFGSAYGSIASDQAMEIAEVSGASVMLWGRILPDGENVSVAWELVDVDNGQSLDAGVVAGEEPDGIVDRIVMDVLIHLAAHQDIKDPVAQIPVSELTTPSREAFGHFMAGRIAAKAWRVQEALREYERAVQIDSTFALAFFRLSKFFMGLGGRDRDMAQMYAEQAWRNRVHLGVKDRLILEAWRIRLQGTPAQALAAYEKLLSRYPDDFQVLNEYRGILVNNWEFSRALEVSQQMLAILPEEFEILTDITGSLKRSGRILEAVSASRDMVSRHPLEFNAWDELGLSLLMQGEPDSAETAFRRALEVNPSFHYSSHGLAHCDYSRGDVKRAISGLNEILRRGNITNGERFSQMIISNYSPNLAGLHADLGQYHKALEIHDEADRYSGSGIENQIRLNASRGKILMLMGAYDEALECAKVFMGHPDVGDFHRLVQDLLGRAYIAKGDFAAADSLIMRWSERKEMPVRVRAKYHHLSADYALARGDYETAMTHLKEFEFIKFYLNWKGVAVRKDFARAHLMAGDLEAAALELEGLLRVHGGHALGHFELGKVYEEMSRPVDAEQEYKVFLNLWSEADEGLPQLEEARSRLAALQDQQ